MHRCAECAGRTTSLGYREVRFRDLGRDGAGVGLSATTRRMGCVRCGTSSVVGAPELVAGFRMTRALFDAVGAQASTASFASVAHRHGIDRATVRKVWNAWREDLSISATPVFVADVFEVEAGDRTVVVACDAETSRIGGIYPDGSSPGLATWLRDAGPAVVVAGISQIQFLREALPSTRILLDASSLHGWFGRRVEKACRMIPFPVDAFRVLAKAFAERSEKEDALLASVVRGGGEIGALAVELDRIRSSFERGGSRPPAGARPVSTTRIVRHLEACRRMLGNALDAVDTGGTARRVAARRPAGPNGRIRGEGLDRLAARTAIAQAGAGDAVDPPREFFWADDEMVDAVGLDTDVAAKPDPDVPDTGLPLPPPVLPSPDR